ncbi:hypothetical protein AO373_0425 [Moraxella catarrhalis]|uniref:Uncharacterized protein n=1 Tax=Moraxella catarrhalis TaxID=480 RepID=A0AB36DM37_MORCA|nr:hypothetical protein AO379_1836 [Moraxella catarrhalis]OAV19533.1 hypothetical protein AO373_0425 [Moraxella catarrhalis]OAV24468.1 hypothetical protein AO370_1414 [Moraxella catarrhalis]
MVLSSDCYVGFNQNQHNLGVIHFLWLIMVNTISANATDLTLKTTLG